MSLESHLSEEDKHFILNEVERERRRKLVIRLFRQGLVKPPENLSHDEKAGIKNDIYIGTMRALPALAEVDKDEFVRLVKICTSNLSAPPVPSEVYVTLAKVNRQDYLDLCEAVNVGELTSRNPNPNYLSLMDSASRLIQEEPELFPKLFHKLISDGFTNNCRNAAADWLESLVPGEAAKLWNHYNSWRTLKGYRRWSDLHPADEWKDYGDIGGDLLNHPLTLWWLAVSSPEEFMLSFEGRWWRDYRNIPPLILLADKMPGQFMKIFSICRNQLTIDDLTDNRGVGSKLMKLLYTVAQVDPLKYMLIYRRRIERAKAISPCYIAPITIAQSISGLAQSKPDLFLKLCEEEVLSEHSGIRLGAAMTLDSVLKISENIFLELYHKLIGSLSEIQLKAGTSLEYYGLADRKVTVSEIMSSRLEKDALAGLNSARMLRLVREMNSCLDVAGEINPRNVYINLVNNATTRFITSAAIRGLATTNPQKFKELMEEGMHSEDYAIRAGTATNLELLTGIDTDKFFRWYSEGIKDPFLCYSAAKSIGGLALTLNTNELQPIRDEEFSFFENVVHSNYTSGKSKDEMIGQLNSLSDNGTLDYSSLGTILQSGLAGDLNEMVECSTIKLEGYTAIKRHAYGGWSVVYLIRRNNDQMDIIKVLKIPSKNLQNSNVQHIIDKHNGSIEEALKFMAKEEEIVSELVGNTFWETGSFRYKPLPQFCGYCKVNIGDIELPGLIYEFIPGETLDKRFRAVHNTLKERMSRYFGKPISDSGIFNGRSFFEDIDLLSLAASAINYIHTKGFVHNDLKSDNLIVGTNRRVYLLDLAFSRQVDTESTIKGARAYTAPERVLGNVPGTIFSDQYSFGVMVYELLTGEKPIHFGTTEEEKEGMALKVFKGEIKPNLDLLRSKTYTEVAQIIKKCLSFRPAERYASMGEVSSKLSQLGIDQSGFC